MKSKRVLYFSGMFLVLFCGAWLNPLWAGSERAIGYFYMSGRFVGESRPEYEGMQELPRDAQDSLKSYVTDVHGPFRTRLGAKRAMREHKRREKDRIYFTRIFKL